MAMPHDARERAELCARFTEFGPDAPTLCGDWTTADLAAHLVARERNPISGPGILVGGPFGSLTDWATKREARKGYEAVVERVRTGPPVVPWGLPVLREFLNLNEYFVHHEDVRRANGLTPRTDRPDLQAALTKLVRRMGPLLLRRAGLDAELVDAGGESLVSRGHRPATVSGPVGELVLFLNGRQSVAEVTYEGDAEAVRQLQTADLGI